MRVALLLIVVSTFAVLSRGAREPSGLAPARLSAPTANQPDAVAIRVLFQRTDCPAALEALSRLNRIAAMDGADVAGVILDPYPDEDRLSRLRAGTGIGFELKPDSGTAKVVKTLGFRKTPIVLLYDGNSHLVAAYPISGPGYPLAVETIVQSLEARIRKATRKRQTRPDPYGDGTE